MEEVTPNILEPTLSFQMPNILIKIRDLQVIVSLVKQQSATVNGYRNEK